MSRHVQVLAKYVTRRRFALSQIRHPFVCVKRDLQEMVHIVRTLMNAHLAHTVAMETQYV